MWLCTKHGFYSIVRKSRQETHIRARSEQDLINLRRICTGRIALASGWQIHRSEPADYRWRIVINPVVLQDVLAILARELDYSNFKGVIAGIPGQSEKLGIYSAFHHDLEHWQNAPKP